ncbi:MAG: hypothetical protein GKR94_28820 [Gammaproteobacteria bacterium]|nr:hypothetical protein [Gammaproteobacteria bacterium]
MPDWRVWGYVAPSTRTAQAARPSTIVETRRFIETGKDAARSTMSLRGCFCDGKWWAV